MKSLARVVDYLFGCHHENLSRVFTINKRCYRVCCDCGASFDYCLTTMRAAIAARCSTPRHTRGLYDATPIESAMSRTSLDTTFPMRIFAVNLGGGDIEPHRRTGKPLPAISEGAGTPPHPGPCGKWAQKDETNESVFPENAAERNGEQSSRYH